jgi:hypothetical protein
MIVRQQRPFRGIVFLIGLTTSMQFGQVMVSGNCQLEGALIHNDTKVIFEAASPSAVSDTAYTDNSGDFSIPIIPGLYNIYYNHTGYVPLVFYSELINSARVLDPVALYAPLEISGYCMLEGESSHEGTRIIFRNLDNELRDTVWTNVVGRYEAYLDRAGYEATYEHGGFVAETRQSTLDFSVTLPELTLSTFPSGIVISRSNADSIRTAGRFSTGDYLISEVVNIYGLDTLCVEPGTRLYFLQGATIWLDTIAVFIAEGTAQDSIYFLTYPGMAASVMLNVNNTTITRMAYCVFDGAGMTQQGFSSYGVTGRPCLTQIMNSRISHFVQTGAYISGEVLIQNSIFETKNRCTSLLLTNALGQISNNRFVAYADSSSDFIYIHGGPVDFSHNQIILASKGPYLTAIRASGGPLSITRNLIIHPNPDYLIDLTNSVDTEFAHNIIFGYVSDVGYGHGYGLYCYGANVLIRNMSITASRATNLSTMVSVPPRQGLVKF